MSDVRILPNIPINKSDSEQDKPTKAIKENDTGQITIYHSASPGRDVRVLNTIPIVSINKKEQDKPSSTVKVEEKACCVPQCGPAKLDELIYLIRDNFLSEYNEEWEKEKARTNLDIYSKEEIDNLLQEYATIIDVDQLIYDLQQAINNKADSSTVQEIIINLQNNYYTKSEINQLISDELAALNGDNIPIDGSDNRSIKQVILDNEEIVSIALNELNQRIINLDTSIYIVVPQRPTQDIKYQKIYVVPSDQPGEENIYVEWIRIKDEVNGDYWEKIGEFKTDIDLSNYWSKNELQASSTEDTLTIQIAGKTIVLEIPQQGTLTTTNITTTGNPTITFTNPTDGATLSYVIKDKQGNTVATGSGTESSVTRTFDVNLDNFSQNPTKYDVFITTKKNGMESEVKQQELTITRKLENPTITQNGVEYDSSRTLTLSHPKAGVTIQYSLDDGTTWLTYDPNNKPVINSTSTVLARAIKDDWVNSDNASANVTVGTLKMYWSVILYDIENDKEGDNPSTAANIETLTSINKKSFPVTIPVSGYGRTCFAYNKNLGKLTSIKDDNGFEYIAQFINSQGDPLEVDNKYYFYVLQHSAEQFGHFIFNK